jgi:hypothetical protein
MVPALGAWVSDRGVICEWVQQIKSNVTIIMPCCRLASGGICCSSSEQRPQSAGQRPAMKRRLRQALRMAPVQQFRCGLPAASGRGQGQPAPAGPQPSPAAAASSSQSDPASRRGDGPAAGIGPGARGRDTQEQAVRQPACCLRAGRLCLGEWWGAGGGRGGQQAAAEQRRLACASCTSSQQCQPGATLACPPQVEPISFKATLVESRLGDKHVEFNPKVRACVVAAVAVPGRAAPAAGASE